MKHPGDDQLRAYLDREAAGEDRQRIDAHLSTCAICRQRVDELRLLSERVQLRLTSLDAGSPLWSTQKARQQLDTFIERKQKENQPMFKTFIRRPAWIGLAIVLVFGLSLAFPPVRALATSFLKIFRVQQIAVIPVDPGNIADKMEGSSVRIEDLLSENLNYNTLGEQQTVGDAAEASELAGFEPRLPSNGEEVSEIVVQPGANGSFTIDVERVNLLLKELDQEDLSLSPELNGATVDFEIPSAVAATFGTCDLAQFEDVEPENMHDFPNTMGDSDCTVFMQMPSPTVTAPDGLDLNRLGQAFFRVAGMSEQEAALVSAKIDWSTTLVIPIPVTKSKVSDVQVDGVNGLLIQEDRGTANDHFVLTWVKDGQLYAVTGTGDPDRSLELVDSLQ